MSRKHTKPSVTNTPVFLYDVSEIKNYSKSISTYYLTKSVMKYLLLISLLIQISVVSAQSNLDFNQVLLVTNGTVPAGKVWKVESAIYSLAPLSLSNGANAQEDKITINGTTTVIRKSTSYNPYYSGGNGSSQAAMTYIWETHFPLWFPAGTTIQVSTGVTSLSILEFNVAQ